MALSTSCQEGIWLKQLLTEIYSSTKTINVNIKCDSQSAIALALNLLMFFMQDQNVSIFVISSYWMLSNVKNSI